MAKNKLKKFADNAVFPNVVEPKRDELLNDTFSLKGRWNQDFFKNENPIVLELGCGRGDYTTGLASRFPEKNFIGVDIKGARIWAGAKACLDNDLHNGAFLRTQIELIENCFAKKEVSEIWITFPDPQIKYKRAKHRLTHPAFLKRYKNILRKNGIIHLKSDSEFLHGYTHGIIQILGLPVYEAYHDIYTQVQDRESILFTIKTYYEQMWLEQGKAITYLKFGLEAENDNEPDNRTLF